MQPLISHTARRPDHYNIPTLSHPFPSSADCVGSETTSRHQIISLCSAGSPPPRKETPTLHIHGNLLLLKMNFSLSLFLCSCFTADFVPRVEISNANFSHRALGMPTSVCQSAALVPTEIPQLTGEITTASEILRRQTSGSESYLLFKQTGHYLSCLFFNAIFCISRKGGMGVWWISFLKCIIELCSVGKLPSRTQTDELFYLT